MGALQEAARLLCCGRPSTRFITLLRDQINTFAIMAGGYRTLPTRVDMRKDLETTRRCAGTLAKVLDDPAFAVLACDGRTDLDWVALAGSLRELETRSKEALKKIKPAQKGQSPLPALSNGVSVAFRPPELVCAVITASAWRAARGHEIAPGSSDAQQAAEFVWTAAGLESVARGKSLRRWERWLDDAKKLDPNDTSAGSITPGFIRQWRDAAFSAPH